MPVSGAVTSAELQLRLACDEMERRLQAGETCRAEELLAAHPGVAGDEECALDLIYTEYVIRQRLGQRPDENEWYRRFPAQQEQLRRLFRFHELLGGDASSPSTNVSRRTPPGGRNGPAAAPPRQLGQYELLDEIGRGGMGVVYRAWQRGLERQVAVKMILAGALASDEELTRFQTEAQAAASLQHPHIVQVFEVGEENGQHFLSLEFVAGPSLEKHLAGTPAPVRDAAQLVETLARTMQHAHDRGIVHRDLKPANILLEFSRRSVTGADDTPAPVADRRLNEADPKIADFGLAKRLHADAGQTRTHAVVGTPSYMAPEQTEKGRGALGPAADVYALGAILYECLTGRPPFKGENALDTLLQVRNQEPVPPGRLRPNLPRDLEIICLKCLQKEPAKRYASAAALADDLAAWREGRPIRARPTPVWERGVKWARRRPALAGLIVVSLLSVVSLIGGAFWHIRQLNSEIANKEAQRRRAQANGENVSNMVDLLVGDVVGSGLVYLPGSDKFMLRLLKQALEYRQELLEQPDVTATQREHIGRIHQRIGTIYLLLRRVRDAEQTLRDGVAYFEKLAADFPEERDHKRQLAVTLHFLGELLEKLPDRRQDAAEAYRKAVQHQQELVAAEAADRRYRRDLARHYHGLGGLLHRAQDFAGAEKYYRDAFRLREELAAEAADAPDVGDFHLALAQSHQDLGALRQERKRYDEADQHYQEALRLLEASVEKTPPRFDYLEALALTLSNRGTFFKDRKNPAEAEKHYRRALVYREKLVEEYSERPHYRHQLALTLMQLGNLLLEKKDRQAEGEEVLRQARKHRQTLAQVYGQHAENHSHLGLLCHQLALAASRRGRPAEAAALLLEAIHHQDKAVQADPQPRWKKYLQTHRSSLGNHVTVTLARMTGW